MEPVKFKGTGTDRDGNLLLRTGTAELSHKVSRLLSQEPIFAPVGMAYEAPLLDMNSTYLEHEVVSGKNKQIAMLEEKLKRLQKELTQVRFASDSLVQALAPCHY